MCGALASARVHAARTPQDIAAPAGEPVTLGPTDLSNAKDVVAAAGTPVPYNASAATAAAQSAAVMGQAVLLRTRLMYQLF